MATRTIPSNYNSMDGKARNIVETVIFDGIYIFIIYLLKLPFKYDLYIALGMIPISALSLIGVGGQSLIQSLINYLRFLKKRRVLSEPSQEYIREKNKAIMLKKQKEKSGKRGRVNGK